MLLPIDRRVNNRIPWVTFALIVANTAAFIAVFLSARSIWHLSWLFERYGAIPANLATHAVLTHMFMHGNMPHLIGNMAFLAMFGMNVERRIGPAAYLGLYLLSGLTSLGLFILFDPKATIPLVGASGAISGVTGMYLALFARRVVDVFWIFGTFRAPAFFFIAAWLGMEVVFALTPRDQVTIAHWAHVGGFLGGWLALFALLRLGFRGHPELLPPEPPKLDAFTELKYIPTPVRPAAGTYALLLRRHEPGRDPFAARGLEFAEAERKQKESPDTVIVASERIVRLPPMAILNAVSADGTVILLEETGTEQRRDGELVYLLTAGRVGGKLVADLFITSPFTDFRIGEAVSLVDLARTAGDLLRALPQAFSTPGFRALASGGAVPEFASQGEFDRQNLWALQMLVAGQKDEFQVPRSSGDPHPSPGA
jgi:membrane associated rhomboid family serine protease